MVRKGIIQPENRELCRYGVQQLFTIMLNIIVTLTIGLLMGMVLESVLSTAAYIPLRSYAGGYHAKTPLRCCIFSGVLIAFVLLAMRYIPLSLYVIIGVWIASGVVIALLAPVADKNKPLDDIEVKVYRKRALIIWAVEVILSAGLIIADFQMFVICIMWAIAVACLMVVLGGVKIKNVFRLKNHYN